MEKYYRWFYNNWLNVLLGLYIGFIFFTTLIPFRFIFHLHLMGSRFHGIQWIPFLHDGTWSGRSDIVANIIFFIPLGIGLGLRKILLKYENFSHRDWVHILLTGFGISFMVEFLQLFTYNRDTSTTDVITNSLGTLMGAALILFIYLRFHKSIKAILFGGFADKPEMIFAGIFLIFIFVGQSAPFTFSLTFATIGRAIQELLYHPFHMVHFLGDLLSGILVYGTLSYFLFTGMDRYHSRYFRSRKFWAVVAFIFMIPFLLEIYQLLLPERNHSIADVLIADAGILYGILFFAIQRKGRRSKEKNNMTNEIWMRKQAVFFRFMIFVYLLYLGDKFFYPVHPIPDLTVLRETFRQDIRSTLALLKYQRLEFVISIIKEVFSFLPAGFILSLIWYKNSKWSQNPDWLFFLLLLFLPVMLLTAAIFWGSHRIFFQDFPSAWAGIGLGYACWQTYEFMISRKTV